MEDGSESERTMNKGRKWMRDGGMEEREGEGEKDDIIDTVIQEREEREEGWRV